MVAIGYFLVQTFDTVRDDHILNQNMEIAINTLQNDVDNIRIMMRNMLDDEDQQRAAIDYIEDRVLTIEVVMGLERN